MNIFPLTLTVFIVKEFMFNKIEMHQSVLFLQWCDKNMLPVEDSLITSLYTDGFTFFCFIVIRS